MSTAFWNMVYAQCFDNQIKNVKKTTTTHKRPNALTLPRRMYEMFMVVTYQQPFRIEVC